MNLSYLEKVTSNSRAFSTSAGGLLLVAALLTPSKANTKQMPTLKSPDGRVVVLLELEDGIPHWSLSYRNTVLLDEGRLGIQPSDSPLVSLDTVDLVQHNHQQTVATVWGKTDHYNNNYNQVTWTLEETLGKRRKLNVILRVYNEGVAVRYECPQDGNWPERISLTTDLTEFRFAHDSTAWSYNGEHSPVGPQSLSHLHERESIAPPLTIQRDSQTYMAILEAAVFDHAPFRLVPDQSRPLTFRAEFALSNLKQGGVTSWRVVLLGDQPGDLLVAPLVYCLNPPCRITETDWIEPGLAMWDWRVWGARTPDGFTYGLDMASWRRLIDFASQSGVRYVLLDANWYGPEFDPQSDPRKSRDHIVIQPDSTKPEVIRKPAPADWQDPVDIPSLIRYAKQHQVGVILYINDVARHNFPFEETLKLYHEWGAAGIKYGFMKSKGQQKVLDTREIVELCAKYQLLCDFHDGPIGPSGDERTFPNYLAREFCHAQSDAMRSFGPADFCKTVFVNMLAGPLDMNNGLYSLTDAQVDRPRIFTEVQSTVVAETARVLITYSGLAILPDTPEAYQQKADLFDFIRRLPMTWDETHILSGEIGSHIATARRSGTTWYVGTVTNEDARTLSIELDFLQPNSTYTATLYEDAADTHYESNRETYRVHKRSVTSQDVMQIHLAAGGGHCMLLELQ